MKEKKKYSCKKESRGRTEGDAGGGKEMTNES